MVERDSASKRTCTLPLSRWLFWAVHCAQMLRAYAGTRPHLPAPAACNFEHLRHPILERTCASGSGGVVLPASSATNWGLSRGRRAARPMRTRGLTMGCSASRAPTAASTKHKKTGHSLGAGAPSKRGSGARCMRNEHLLAVGGENGRRLPEFVVESHERLDVAGAATKHAADTPHRVDAERSGWDSGAGHALMHTGAPSKRAVSRTCGSIFGEQFVIAVADEVHDSDRI
ncbi:hypothetical protein B0H14DRAFT_3137526 [Mycena olivaceomarginata]|nr:hypothetical protein B0H14DRAFT_3137526 [Mycena olivaceomarginata]